MASEQPMLSRQCSSHVWPNECAQGRNASERSSVANSNTACIAFTFEVMLPWLRMTPFGIPVVPEV
jgi:hypothetical protein